MCRRCRAGNVGNLYLRINKINIYLNIRIYFFSLPLALLSINVCKCISYICDKNSTHLFIHPKRCNKHIIIWQGSAPPPLQHLIYTNYIHFTLWIWGFNPLRSFWLRNNNRPPTPDRNIFSTYK